MKKRYKKILNKAIVDSFKTTTCYHYNYSSFPNVSKIFGQSYSNIFVSYNFFYNQLDRLNGILDIRIYSNKQPMHIKSINATFLEVGKKFHNYLIKTIKEKFAINIKAKVITYNNTNLDNQVSAFFQ